MYIYIFLSNLTYFIWIHAIRFSNFNRQAHPAINMVHNIHYYVKIRHMTYLALNLIGFDQCCHDCKKKPKISQLNYILKTQI